MSCFSYLLKRNVVNYIKSIKHKPSKAVPIVFYVVMLFFLVFATLSNDTQSLSKNNISYFTGTSTLVCFVIFLFVIYSGTTRKNFKYSMSDVNLIFTSPIKPQNVLLYGFIKEISFIFAMSFVVVCQIPNLANHVKFVKYGIGLFMIITILFLISISFTSLLMYGLFVKFAKAKKIFTKILKILYAFLIILLASNIYFNSNGNYFSYAMKIFNMDSWSYIPIVGWARNAINQCVLGFNNSIYLYILLLLLTDILFCFILYKINIDFYEDTLTSAEQNEAAVALKNNGYNTKDLDYKNKGFKPLLFNKKVDMSNLPTYSKAIFIRHLLEYKKTGFYFINLASIGYLLFSLFWGYSVKGPYLVLFFISIYVLWLSSNAGKWCQDFYTHYIFLMPDNSASKLFYSTLSSVIKYIVDSLFIFIPAGILLNENPLIIISYIITYASFGFVITYGAVLNYKLFDRVSNQMIRGLFQLFSLFIFIIPGIIIGSLLSFYFNFLGDYALPVSMTIYNIIISLIIIKYCKSIYDTLEI